VQIKNGLKRLLLLILTPVLAFLFVFYLRFFGHDSRFMPVCLFHHLTGLYCPGCGSGRMLVHLCHLEIIPAFFSNPLGFLLLPGSILYLFKFWMDQILNRKSPGDIRTPGWVPVMAVAVIILYSVLRNLDFYPFVLLAPH
jgi:hypothetical protein